MISAASTASGRFLKSGVRNKTVITVQHGGEVGELRARAGALVAAVWERLPPAASPPMRPDAELATPSAISSWLESIS